jgi:hypothetical protein
MFLHFRDDGWRLDFLNSATSATIGAIELGLGHQIDAAT